jgi:hypothetical protein
MRWRVVVELTGLDGTVHTHEVSAGGATAIEHSSATIGLTLLTGSGRSRDCRAISFGGRRRNIAVDGGAARVVGLNGRSRMYAPGGCCRCSERWRFGRRAFCPVGVR